MINPVGFYSNLDYGSVYSDYKSVANSYITAPQPFVMDTRRCTPQLSDYIIYPDEKTKEIVENAREMFAEYEKEEKYKIQPKDFLYKSTPIWSRLDTAHKLAEQGDYFSAFTVGSLALLFGPEDLREVKTAVKQIKALVKGDNSFIPDYDYTKAQHPGSFFRGSILHKKMNPFAPNSKYVDEKLWLLEQDKALIQTKLGKKVLDYFDIKTEKINTDIEEILQVEGFKNNVQAYKFIGKSSFGKLTARAMTRTPVLSLVADAGVEALSIRHEVKQGKNLFKALKEGILSFTTTALLTAFFGALGSYFGPAGSLLGVTLGIYTSKKIENAIC